MGGLDSGLVQYVHDAAAAAGGIFADGVGMHPYGVVPDAAWCPNPGEDLNCDWGTIVGKIDAYYAAAQLPVWITEFGLKTTDTQHAATYLTDAYRAIASKGSRVGPAFVFCESDAMVAPFGLTDENHAQKPHVYAAYKALTQAASPEEPAPDEPATHADRLHGTVHVGGVPIEGLTVTAWGHAAGDFHRATTDALGIYELTGLDPRGLYNIVVNARFEDGAFVAEDPAHDVGVRDNVELVAGPDGWHGEDFELAY